MSAREIAESAPSVRTARPICEECRCYSDGPCVCARGCDRHPGSGGD